ncbi:hypothetical protein EC844_1388 [Acinetobacter calcoaceticus]|uniref:Uncharacterized protein n=1 Tax=Acinetobacter calcoaceticus TaxID=471 RepID=A0A4R1XBL6_ACICA|nr:hypothetical protein EC844_1388 [Acinetobacter calcoaceticus]
MIYTLIDQLDTAKLKVPGFIDFMTSDGQSIWVTNRDSLQKLNAEQTNPIYSAFVPQAAGIPVYAFDSVWVASLRDQAIYRIDPDTGALLALIATGLADQSGEFSLAASQTRLWVVSAEGQLAQIDPEQNQVTSHTAILPNSYNLCSGFDALWLSNPITHSVQRIDPHSGMVTDTIEVGECPWFLCASEQAIWTLNQRHATVSKINPLTRRCEQTIQLPMLAQGIGGDIFASHAKIWVRSTEIFLIEIDAYTGTILQIIQHDQAAGSGAVYACSNKLWITAHDIETLWIMDIV